MKAKADRAACIKWRSVLTKLEAEARRELTQDPLGMDPHEWPMRTGRVLRRGIKLADDLDAVYGKQGREALLARATTLHGTMVGFAGRRRR